MFVDLVLLGLGVSGGAAFGTEVAAEHDYNLDAGHDHESPAFDAGVDLRLLDGFSVFVVNGSHNLHNLLQVSVPPELHDRQNYEEIDSYKRHTRTVETTHGLESRH